MCVCEILFSHSCHSCILRPGVIGNLTEGRGGGGAEASISPARRSLSGLVLVGTAGGAGMELPNPVFMSPYVFILLMSVSITDYLLSRVFFLSCAADKQVVERTRHDFIFFSEKKRKVWRKPKAADVNYSTYFSCGSVLDPSGSNTKLGPAVSLG